jgi:DNA sulfur modification protein DndE
MADTTGTDVAETELVTLAPRMNCTTKNRGCYKAHADGRVGPCKCKCHQHAEKVTATATAPYRVALSQRTTSVLRSLTSKTGLSANVLARFAMLISFEDENPPAIDGGTPSLVINRATLFGELEPFLMSAYALAATTGGSRIGKELASHIARGAAYLNVRVESLTDLLALVTEAE